MHGVGITQDNEILVTDSNNIQKLTVDGKLIASISQRTCSIVNYCNLMYLKVLTFPKQPDT